MVEKELGKRNFGFDSLVHIEPLHGGERGERAAELLVLQWEKYVFSRQLSVHFGSM